MRCPACGKGKLFHGFLKIVPVCPVCGADFADGDSGDGPAVFVILVLGFLVVGAALFVEVRYTPPLWVHAALWLPAILGGSAIMLPVFKSVLFALRYHHDAGERVTRVDR